MCLLLLPINIFASDWPSDPFSDSVPSYEFDDITDSDIAINIDETNVTTEPINYLELDGSALM